MFLTKIDLDPRRRQTRRYLGSPQVMHAVIMKAVDGAQQDDSGRVLWRVDQTVGTSLYLLSPTEPDCTQIIEEAGAEDAIQRTLDYSPFLNRLAEDQIWAFRLMASPTRSVPTGMPNQRGKRYGHVTIAQQRDWLIRRANGFGFALVPTSGDDEADVLLDIHRRERPVFGRKNPDHETRDKVTINRTLYEGVLRVIDPDQLRHSLTHGIGRSKAYGCGLMTLARPD
ncbi:MAG: type I-E CRISPR-associated protein Cas6/Cse3/CasE [Actinomycetaceae bacterium]|nr:type I-E CRISPR-associated protein Cas6/Cse3/CasE [Actinomycetaceae bacterium]